MREIKFRAWLKSAKEMCEVTTVNFRERYVHLRQNNAPDYVALLDSEVELMQYTGLKDKNCKEIYEGDIFRRKNGEVGVVKYHDVSFVLDRQPLNDDAEYIEWPSMYYYGGAVIGNIHDNPELLK